jgi:hypothetical protein
MVKRLLVGLVLGLVVGGLVAALAIKGLGLAVLATGGGAALAYLLAAVTGAATGLVAGKPIWASGGKIEAGLKAFFGALIAAGILGAVRTWLHVNLDLGSLGAGAGEIGTLPAVVFPMIAGLLGAFYGADNTPEDASKDKAAPGSKAGPKVRVASGVDEVEEEEDVAEEKKAKRG